MIKNNQCLEFCKQNLLTGSYKLSGAYLKPIGETDFRSLLISQRKEPTVSKPSQFILLINSEGKRKYISSLYPKGKGVYEFEYLKVEYELRIEGKKCSISVLEVENA